jgi:hypothetical protein
MKKIRTDVVALRLEIERLTARLISAQAQEACISRLEAEAFAVTFYRRKEGGFLAVLQMHDIRANPAQGQGVTPGDALLGLYQAVGIEEPTNPRPLLPPAPETTPAEEPE